MEVNKIYCENCLTTMKKMSDSIVDLVVTSPPYDGLRLYNGYSFEIIPTIQSLYRILKPGGVIIWVVADQVINGSETGNSMQQALSFKAAGFNIHDTMIYFSKPRYPDPTRYGNCWEYMFVFSKGRPKTINLIKDRKNRWTHSFGVQSKRSTNGQLSDTKKIEFDEYGVRFNIWKYNTGGMGQTAKDEIAYHHPAIFPEELAHDHILSWSNEGDLIYDPFGGSGTTPKMAALLNRNWLMSEISEEYCSLAEKRIKPYISINKLF